MCELVGRQGLEIIDKNSILLERAKDLFKNKIKQTLEYRNKKSNTKGIAILSENPLNIRLTQNIGGMYKISEFDSKSFNLSNNMPNIIRDKLGKNNKTIKDCVKNKELLSILKIFDPGDWKLITIQSKTDNKKINYFQSERGLIYHPKLTEYF